jgi:hypothetical protein
VTGGFRSQPGQVNCREARKFPPVVVVVLLVPCLPRWVGFFLVSDHLDAEDSVPPLGSRHSDRRVPYVSSRETRRQSTIERHIPRISRYTHTYIHTYTHTYTHPYILHPVPSPLTHTQLALCAAITSRSALLLLLLLAHVSYIPSRRHHHTTHAPSPPTQTQARTILDGVNSPTPSSPIPCIPTAQHIRKTLFP